jgi:hypothetical protein
MMPAWSRARAASRNYRPPNPKSLELLVERKDKCRLIIVGLVSLGSHPARTSEIHRNLKVRGKLLGKGTS